VTQPEGGALDPQGPVSGAMADLFWLMLGLGVVVFLVVAVVLVLGLFRRRQEGEPPPGRQRPNSFGRWFVVGGVVAPLVILIVVFGATVRAMRYVPTTAPQRRSSSRSSGTSSGGRSATPTAGSP
jgi:cytochrome c oxidase subunit II